MPSILRPDSTIVTLGLAAVLAAGVSLLATYVPRDGVSASAIAKQQAKTNATVVAALPEEVWQASAPGRVKPNDGEVRVMAEAGGVITAVHASANDDVRVGDPLAVLKKEEAVSRLSAARAEVEVRIAERDEEKETDKAMLAWRKALDELSDAERALHDARVKFDRLYIARRNGSASNGEVANARKAIAATKTLIEQRRESVRDAASNEELPPPSRLDSGLEIARSDLKLAEMAYDRMTVRATADGKVLQFDARVGEMVSPSSTTPVAIVGDLSNLKVTAEVEERDIGKIELGQAVVVRSNAFDGEDFAGKVTRIASRVATPGLGLRGRNEPRDVEVLEVEILLDGNPPLLSGMRVDVFFKAKGVTKAAARN